MKIGVSGRSIASLACAAQLFCEKIPFSMPDGPMSDRGLAVIGRDVLHALPVNGAGLSSPIEMATTRRLSEDGVASEDPQEAPGLIVAREELARVLADSVGEHAGQTDPINCDVVVDDNTPCPAWLTQRGAKTAAIPRVQQAVYLNWDDGEERGPVHWIRFTGETLSDIDATATVLRSGSRITLILSAPMKSIIEQSIALTDVLARFMAHQAVRDVLPDSYPSTVNVRLLNMRANQAITVGRPIIVRIGDAIGQSDPVSLDPELSSANQSAHEISRAFRDSDLTVARLSRISRRSHSRPH